MSQCNAKPYPCGDATLGNNAVCSNHCECQCHKEKMKHSKLPWKVFCANNPRGPILGIGMADGTWITSSNGGLWGDELEAKANAEFIVKAVNAHEELVEAAKDLIGHTKANLQFPHKDSSSVWQAISVLEKVLQKAEAL